MLPRPTRRRFLASISAALAAPALPQSAFALSNPPPTGLSGSIGTYVNVMDFGAVANGGSNPALNYFPSLGALQSFQGALYSFATALTSEMDWLAAQAACNSVAHPNSGGVVFFPRGTYVLSNANSATDFSGQLSFVGVGVVPLVTGAVSLLGEPGASILTWPSDLGQNQFATFTGSISGSTLTVSSSVTGAFPLAIGQTLWTGGVGGTRIARITAGSGTSWTVDTPQTIGSTTITAITAYDMAARGAAIVCDNLNQDNGAAYGYIDGLVLSGPGGSSLSIGNVPAQMVGIATNDRRRISRTTVTGYYAGVMVLGGQTHWEDLYLNYNFYGAYWSQQSSQFGDTFFERCDLSVNNKAGIACSRYAFPQTSIFTKCIFDFEPYAILKEPGLNGGSNDGAILYDCTFDQCQFENIGNALIGDGLTAGGNFTASISSANPGVMTVTAVAGGTVLNVGHKITGVGISGNFTIAALGTGTGGTGTYVLSGAPGAVSSRTMTASRIGFVWNTRLTGCEFLWNTATPPSGPSISTLPQTGIIECFQALGLYIEHPVTTFAWTPGQVGLFDIAELSNSAPGAYSPTEIFKISGDVSTLVANCQTAGLPFFGTQSFVGQGAALLDNQGFWQGEATYAQGFSSIPLGSIVLTTSSVATLSGGSPSDNVQGILLLQGVQGIVAYSGIVNVATGSNVISAGQYVRTSSAGQGIAAASGAADTTSKIIGVAVTASSGGITAVRLQGLR